MGGAIQRLIKKHVNVGTTAHSVMQLYVSLDVLLVLMSAMKIVYHVFQIGQMYLSTLTASPMSRSGQTTIQVVAPHSWKICMAKPTRSL